MIIKHLKLKYVNKISKEAQGNEANTLLGTVDEFHSQKCYDLYLYAVGFAKQINEYIDKGYIVLDGGDDVFKNKFVFYKDRPCVAERSGNCSFIYFGSTFDYNGKVWLHGEESKSSIKKRFTQFRMVNPSNIERVSFNCA